MAGQGPPPKANRRRSNAPARGDWVDLAPLDAPVLPPLPEFYAVCEDSKGEMIQAPWPAATVELWEAWRTDPVTVQWGPADLALAADTIRLHASSPVNKASEIRLRMDNLGLSPKGKRDNRWRLPKDAPATEGDGPQAEVRRLKAV